MFVLRNLTHSMCATWSDRLEERKRENDSRTIGSQRSFQVYTLCSRYNAEGETDSLDMFSYLQPTST